MFGNRTPEQEVPGDGMTPEQATRIIHSHRRVRYGTACWPCRQRKVKCDRKKPCENCLKREHPRLCSYKPSPSKVKRKTPAYLSLPHQNDSSNDESQDDQQTIANSPDLGDPGALRFLGRNSIPFLLQEQTSSPINQEGTVSQDIQSILGLDTSAPFPLMSSRHLQMIAQDISDALPSNREVIKLFRVYKDIPHHFWGYVQDLDSFETNLMVYLEHRSQTATKETPSVSVTASWLAILFAILALGSQFNDAPYYIRTRDSQRYIQTSFHFLRLDNFLLRPSLGAIQALLLTGLVLINDMKAEASWALMGLTCRLAQSIGMHRQGVAQGILDSQDIVRRRVWWSCVWHDTLMSLSFDRSPVTNSSTCSIPETLPHGELSYIEFMYHLTEIGSRRLNPDTISNATYGDIMETCQSIEGLRYRTIKNIQFKDKCKSTMDHLHNYAVRLNASFIKSVACRPAIQKKGQLDPEKTNEVTDLCMVHLTETVKMFLAMHQLSVIPTRSWAFIYHGLSSALLLGIICQTKPDAQARHLQGELIDTLSRTTDNGDIGSSAEPHIRTTARDIELSGHLWRALAALKNIYNHGSIISSDQRASHPAGDSNNEPPFCTTNQGIPPNNNAIPPDSYGLGSQQPAVGTEGNHHNACQQGLTPDRQEIRASNVDTFNTNTSNFAWLDSLAPMDLYESIWSGKFCQDSPMLLYINLTSIETPNLWTWGGDNSLNFDFPIQNPPNE
ncbi:Fc.00g026600.m01.CDS01 [Cosmosporella sp. VM-42]